ncbi:MAG: phosphatase PAP2 family protein [Candidatus Cloacimonetes bacterium]|nr:phosphatase PAP2 family protein [Candidatus Cloacimonadota bacterium]
MTKRSSEPVSAALFRLNKLDYITIAYCLWVILYMLIGWSRAESPRSHLPAYVSIVTGIMLLAWLQGYSQIRWGAGSRISRILHFIRSVYPIGLFGYFFISLYVVNRIIFRSFLDPLFMEVDHLIFGYYPSLKWGLVLNQAWIQEIISFAYFCYYPMIAGLPVYFYFRDREAFDKLIFTLAFSFYVCYFLFALVPVVGGRYLPEAHALTIQNRGWLFGWIMAMIYRASEHWGGAFPSSHIIIALILSFSALAHLKRLGVILLLICVFLSIATVFLHYHWFIDMVAGVLIAPLLYWFAGFVYRKLPE